MTRVVAFARSWAVAIALTGLACCAGTDTEATGPGGAPPSDATQGPATWPGPDDTGPTGPLRQVGSRVVVRRGAVLENLEVQGTLTVQADRVTIRNVLVRPNSYYGILVQGQDVLIEDTKVEGANLATMAGIAAEGGSFVATRVEVTGVEDGVRLGDDCALTDSYIHGLAGDRGSHFDGVTADGGFTGWRIAHNTILNPHAQTGAVWVGDGRYGPSEGEMRDNLVAGGGYTVYAGPGTGRGIRVVGNAFSTRYHERSGRWGPSTSWDPDGNLWQDNYWLDGPREGDGVRPGG
jgi:hypothetical protein